MTNTMDTYYTKDLRCLTVFGILDEEVKKNKELGKELLEFLKRKVEIAEQEE